MNKLLFVSLLIALPLTANAEKGDVLSGDIQQVVELPNMTKANIYNASRQWVATEFNSAQNVIQMDDKENGIIIGKGNIKYPCSGSWLCAAYEKDIVKFTVKIEAKDNKARVTFSDINRYSFPSHSYGVSTPEMTMPVTNTTKKLDTVGQVKDKFDEVITNYKNTVSKASPQNDNW